MQITSKACPAPHPGLGSRGARPLPSRRIPVRSACVAAAVLFLGNCASPESRGWHRPAKPGERVGQVMEVKGTTAIIGVDESCLVHAGDVLSVKRFYCEPGAGRTDTKDCRTFDSGMVRIESINAVEHTATGRIYEGSAVADSPVFMTDPSLSGRLTTVP
jgi:hypothetical protein